MEGKNEFQVALKKTTLMFKTLTGKEITEEEGSIFINLLDMAEGYLATSIQDGTAMMQVAVDDDGGIKVREVSQQEWRELEKVALDVEAGREELTPYVRRTPRDEPYTAPTITTSDRDHIQGYDWQIVVLSREKDEADSYIVHFAHKPTQEQFAEHYVKFQQDTHYVHVNEWIDHGWQSIINRLRASFGETYVGLAPALPGERWEHDDKPFRVRHFSLDTGKITLTYMDRKPSGSELAHYHHTNGWAVIQTRPK